MGSVGPSQQMPSNESKVDSAYLSSIRAILKFLSMLFCFIAFICLVTTTQCLANHVFLASVAWLVILMQIFLIFSYLLRLKAKFTGIDFDLLDFVVTAHDTVYLLIASSVTIHYCRFPGQIAGGVMGIFAFIFLAGDAVVIFLARRDENNAPT